MVSSINRNFFNTRRGRHVLENLTAYLFLAPAGIIIFIFGLFPVLFAFFVSLHRWRRFPEEYRGLDSYVKALGSFAYVIFFWLAAGLIVFGLYSIWRLWRESRAERQAWWFLPPAALVTGALLSIINWFFIILPVVLDVPRRLRGQDITHELFVGEFFASFRVPEALAANAIMLPAVAIAVIALLLFLRLVKTERSNFYFVIALSICGALLAGLLLMQLTLAEIDSAIAQAREAGELLPVWSQIILISAGAWPDRPGVVVMAARRRRLP